MEPNSTDNNSNAGVKSSLSSRLGDPSLSRGGGGSRRRGGRAGQRPSQGRGRGSRSDDSTGRGGRTRARGRGSRGRGGGHIESAQVATEISIQGVDSTEQIDVPDRVMIDSNTPRQNLAKMNYTNAISPFISAPSSVSVALPRPVVVSGGGGVALSHPPIYMARMTTHLSEPDLVSSSEEMMMLMESIHDNEEDHIAEQLAAGLLIDDGDDDYDNFSPIGEEKKVADSSNPEELKDLPSLSKPNMSSTVSTPKGKLQYVKLPAGFSVGVGGNVVSSNEAIRQKKEKHSKAHNLSVNESEDNGINIDRVEQKQLKNSKILSDSDDLVEKGLEEGVKESSVTTSASEAIRKLKVQEVSIGAATKVQVKRTESSMPLSSLLTKKDDSDSPVINFLGKADNKNVSAVEKKSKSKKSKGKQKGPGNDKAASLKAARHFNNSVRACVERSDPDGMREILRDKRNHHYALDAYVLETVMKAYVMAAMFDDALYCLRVCTLPGTLSVFQTEKILQCLPQNLRNSTAFNAAEMINALCIATYFDKPTSRTYFMRIVRGIALEFLEEATTARDRICSAPCERLVRSAQCVVDARLRRGMKPTDLVVCPGNQLGVFIPDTLENRGIQAGDAVSILPYSGPFPMSAESLDRNMIEATVTNAQPLVLRLQDKANTDLYQMLIEPVEGNTYRIDRLANRMGFNRQLAAAVAIASPLEKDIDDSYIIDKRRPSPALIRAITAMDENIDRVMLEGGKLTSHSTNTVGTSDITSTAAICSQAIPWNLSDDRAIDANALNGENHSLDSLQETFRQESLLALEKYGALEGLNASQRFAVQGAVSNRLTLVQGPPGTGKTAVAIRILQHWARLAEAQAKPGENPSPILATSDSNIAVDNLVEGCANVGLRVIRLGRPEAIRPELLRFCENEGMTNTSYGIGGMSTSAFKGRLKILKNAQVVCCTCIGSGGDILDSLSFERVMVDEATQATEPAVLVPLTRGCRQLVLVGDHCQLPPTVLSTKAEEEGLGVPLFSRMVACGVPPFMLDTQYRMHPAISMFPSDLFYGGKLNDGVSPPERRPLQGFPWPREEFPVAFIPVVEGCEIDDGASKANESEAAAVCDAVVALLGGGQCTVADIAVVTPYSAQVRLIRRGLRELLPKGPPFVEVSSTDGFQGREKEAVVFSAVRSNSYGSVGFVSDWRRINVSFTRARRGLIVIGNPDTLRRGDPDTFGAWLQWADAHGVNINSPGKPRGRYEPEVLRKVRGGTTAAEMLKDVLERQQAQLKTAERQQALAEKNAAGHIMGKEDDDIKDVDGIDSQVVKEDLAMLENTDRCWDDDDDDDVGIVRNSSRKTLVNQVRMLEEKEVPDGPLDAWDL